jgi:anthranilate synthase
VKGRQAKPAHNIDPMTQTMRDRVEQLGGLQVLMIDHQDSFVHNLAGYFRQFGVELTTLRPALARQALSRNRYDLVILSPGPARPADYAMSQTIELCVRRKLPLFGVCLGLQGLVEYFGGELAVLGYPMHGKSSRVQVQGGVQLDGLGEHFEAGRYHSLYASRIPDCLQVVAASEDNVPMAVEHKSLPLMAVQFHPESILTLEGNAGLKLIANVVDYACSLKTKSKTG